MNKILLNLALILLTKMAFGQAVDIDNLKSAKPVSLNGSISANTVFSDGFNTGIDPFNYFLSGFLNLSLYQTINIPIYVNYSDRKVSLSQGYSFNQFSINPTYKWISVHAGTNYMNFSPYTLNGHQFMGGGVELSPQKWNVKAMYGRLLKGQYEDSLTTGPTFKRMGYGLSVKYQPEDFTIGASFFKSDDSENSIPLEYRVFENQALKEEENLVVSLDFSTTLFDVLEFTGEYANSIVTKDKNLQIGKSNPGGLAGMFLKGNASSNSYSAFKTGLNYHIAATKTIVGFGFEQIDPDYRTHGGYFFNQDMRNITVNVSQHLLKDAVSFSASTGWQRDNIKKIKATDNKRFIGNINLNAQLNEKLSLAANFTNFQNFMFVNDLYSQITRIPGQPIDSLDYKLISRNFGFNLNQTFKQSDSYADGLNFNFNFLNSSDRRDSKMKVLNSTVGYFIRFIPKDLSLNTGINYFNNDTGISTLRGIGPSLSIQKSLFEKALSLQLNTAYLSTSSSGVEMEDKNNGVINASFIAGYSVKQKHRFQLNFNWVKNSAINPFLNATMGYNYTF